MAVDLTRQTVTLEATSALAAVADQARPLTEDDLTGWTALGLAVTCADLVGSMRGALQLTCDYAKERRQYGRPIGSFQAVQHLLADALVAMEGSRSVALHAAWAVDALPPREALAAAAVAKAYCTRAARAVCETAIQVHGGIGNTWECLAHVYLRRVLLSSDVLGGTGANLARVLEHHGIGAVATADGTKSSDGAVARRRRRQPSPATGLRGRGTQQHGLRGRGTQGTVDFGDSPEEAAFRQRLRDWLRHNNPGLPASSTSDDYWAGQAAWHQALYDGGFFGLSWPKEIGGQDLPSVYDAILDDELAAAGAPPRPSLGYLVQGILEHASDDIKQRFLPGTLSGRERWCQGFSEPDAGSDLASLRTRAERDGDEYVIHGHKVWTSYSDDADWCFLLARTDPDVPKHKGLSVFAVPMRQPGIEQRPLKMMNGVTKEFGEVIFDGARVPAANMIGGPGEGWKLAMTVVSHEREPGELGYVARYRKIVKELTGIVGADPDRFEPEQVRDLGWALVETEMLRVHVCRRLSDRLDGISHGPEGSIDKLLMTSVEQAVGHAALAVGGAPHGDSDDTWLNVYLYSRAQSVMGGTSQIQRNLVASRILGLPAS